MNLRFNLFQNKVKKSEKAPDFQGNGELDGKKIDVAIWKKQDKNGNGYYSFSVRDKQEQVQSQKPESNDPW